MLTAGPRAMKLLLTELMSVLKVPFRSFDVSLGDAEESEKLESIRRKT